MHQISKKFAPIFAAFALCSVNIQAAESMRTVDGIEPPLTYIEQTETQDPKIVWILFPGADGKVDAHVQNGKLRYRKKTNFLLRARELLNASGNACITADSTSNVERFKRLAAHLKCRYPKAALFLLSTSRGTEHAAALSPHLAGTIAGIVYTASMHTLSEVDLASVRVPQLFVHHASDPCRNTPYKSAEKIARKAQAEFIAINGGISVGKPCGPFSHHGFDGVEYNVVDAIKRWAKRQMEEN